MVPLDQMVRRKPGQPLSCTLVIKVDHASLEGQPDVDLGNHFTQVDVDSALFEDKTVKVFQVHVSY